MTVTHPSSCHCRFCVDQPRDVPVYETARARELDLYWSLRDVMAQVDDVGDEETPFSGGVLRRARRVLAAIDPEEMV